MRRPSTCRWAMVVVLMFAGTVAADGPFDGTGDDHELVVPDELGSRSGLPMPSDATCFQFPLNNGNASQWIRVGFDYGNNWTCSGCSGCGGYYKQHTGIDVDAYAGQSVQATADGVIYGYIADGAWGYCALVEHYVPGEGTVFSQYWHVTLQNNVGKAVSRGQTFTTIYNLGGNTHLHFGIWHAGFGGSSTWAGALPNPASGCGNPFPQAWVNPTQYVAARTSCAAACTSSVPADHWKHEAWNNWDLSGSPLSTRDAGAEYIDLNFGTSCPTPECGIPVDFFGERFTRLVPFNESGPYDFWSNHDDGIRLFLWSVLLIDNWTFAFGYDEAHANFLEGNQQLRLDHREGNGLANVTLFWALDQDCFADVPIDHWRRAVYNNTTFAGGPVQVKDDGTGALSFNWGPGSPSSTCLVPADGFSIRWSRIVTIETPGTYRLTVQSDDGFRVKVDGVIVPGLDQWTDMGFLTFASDVALSAGAHRFEIDYYENTLAAAFTFDYALLTSGLPGEASGVGDPPLRVTPSSLVVEKVTGATGYHLYVGSLPTFYTPVTPTCSVASWTDNGDGTVTLPVTIPSNSWVLVSARNAMGEGPIGFDSAGDPIDLTAGVASCHALSLDAGLLARYDFTGNLEDGSASNADLTAQGDAALGLDRFGNARSAISMNAGSGRLTGSASSSFSVSAVTLAAWVRLSGNGGFLPRLVAVGPPGTPSQFYAMGIYGSGYRKNFWFSLPAVGPEVASVSTIAQDRRWHHLAVTYEGSTARLYLDGQFDVARTLPGPIPAFSSAVIQVGGSESGVDLVDGQLDDVRIYGRALSDGEIRRLASVAEATPIQPSDLREWYPIRSSTALDESGFARHGVLTGTSFGADRGGNPGSALVFDGVDDDMKAWVGINGSTQRLTVAAWVNVVGAGTENPRLVAFGPPQIQHWALVLKGTGNPRQVGFLTSGAGGGIATYSTGTLPSDGSWHHVAVTYDESAIRFYIDGSPNGLLSTSIHLVPMSWGVLQVGRTYSGTDRFHGSLDDIRVYARALSSTEVAALAGAAPSAERSE